MKKQTFKNYLKLGIFLFGISLFFVNCDRDDTIQPSVELTKGEVTVKRISLTTLRKNQKLQYSLDKISKHFEKNRKNKNAKIGATDGSFSILTDEILETTKDSISNYTFRIETPTDPTSVFENFVIEEVNDNHYFYIYKYSQSDILGVEFNLKRTSIDENQINFDDFTDYLNTKLVYDDGTGCLFDITTYSFSDGSYYEVVTTYWCPETDSGGDGGDSTGGPDSSGDSSDTGGWSPVSTGGGGGGSPSDNTTNSSNDPANDPNNPANHGNPSVGVLEPIEDEDTLASSVDPCQKIENLFTKYPNYRAKLVTLATKTSELIEHGLQIKKDDTASQNIPSGTTGMLNLDPCPTKKYLSTAHTHNSPANKTYSVFSHGDLAAMARSLYCNKIKTSEFVAFLMTADGTHYAMTIEKPSELKRLHNYLYYLNDMSLLSDINNINDMNTRDKEYRAKLDKYYFNTKDDPKIKVNSTSNTDDELAFLEMLKKHNLGVTLFETDATFTSFTKVSLDTHGVKIDENCPTN